MKKVNISFYLVVGTLFISPALLLLFQSFTAPWRFHTGEKLNFQWTSWNTLFSEPNLLTATIWSIGIGACVLLINLGIGLTSGKALALYPFKGKSFIESLLLAPILIPVLAVAMGLHLFMIRVGIADTWIGVVVIHLVPTIPYSIRIFHHAYSQLGKDLIEQAELLGASMRKQFLTIELPLLRAAIRSVTFLTIVISLSQYAITSIIGGGQVITLPMIFFPFLDTANTSIMAAFAVWFAIPPLVMYVLVEGLLLLLPYSKKYWRN
ncbi:ABC transporter permease subunit [Halobacillus seohaensis]|uniref:ABC transporter permease n=1 Tax=Halobacillus seohaensis TaxID=447421 RepID=A0ABW2EMT0_9BACI